MNQKPLILLVNSTLRPQAIINTLNYALSNNRDVQIIPADTDAYLKTQEILKKNKYKSKKITKNGYKGYYIANSKPATLHTKAVGAL